MNNGSVPSTGGERPSDAMMDMEPRTDISPQITDSLLKQMSDANWKERKEAVETVEGILQRAGVSLSSTAILETFFSALFCTEGGYLSVEENCLGCQHCARCISGNGFLCAHLIMPHTTVAHLVCIQLQWALWVSDGAGGRIEPSFGGLLPALKLRIPDTNRNLAAQVIRLAASVCSATGQRFASSGRTIVLLILRSCSDSKPAVQTAVSQFATEYVMQCGWGSLVEPISEAMGAKCTSGGKVVLLECFISLVSGSHPPQDDQEAVAVLGAAAAGLQDKGLEPRRLAGDLIAHLHAAGITSMPPGAGSLLSADKVAALGEKMGSADGGASTALQAGRTGRLQTTASTRPAPRSASASGRPTTSASGGHSSRGASADPRPATSAGGRTAALGKSALLTQASSASLPLGGADDAEAMVQLMDETEKEGRRVPQRSFKFEQRLGEAKEVHACLSPVISASLASLMFSSDFKKHCLACDKMTVCSTCSPARDLCRPLWHATPGCRTPSAFLLHNPMQPRLCDIVGCV